MENKLKARQCQSCLRLFSSDEVITDEYNNIYCLDCVAYADLHKFTLDNERSYGILDRG